MKAMILAAGLGTRLRPLTDTTPKPLISVGGRPLIHYSLLLLKKYDFKDVLINLHHLGEQIEKALGDGHSFGLNITYSWEPELLGTGGGIKKAESFFKGETFLVMNSDILIDVNLKNLNDFHQRKKAVATMVVRPLPEDSTDTPVYIGNDGNILEIGDLPKQHHQKCGYTGVQILNSKMLDYLPEQKASCIIRQAYQPALKDQLPLFAFHYSGYWNDLGTKYRLQQAENEILQTHLTFMQ